jgi:hypothetical protein
VRTRLLRTLVALVALAAPISAARASAAPATWPPTKGPGVLFVHIGEEHVDDADGMRIFPRVVEDSIRFGPNLVVASGDKASNGTEELLNRWKGVMRAYDGARIPYFAAVGNHDRQNPELGEGNGVLPFGNLGTYSRILADRPYPFGDAAPPEDARFDRRARPGQDPAGASSHYWFDFANVRWIVIDNGCFGIFNCDPFQNPPFPDPEGHQSQYDMLERRAAEAKARGMRVFVAMHMGTQDPRPGHTQPTPSTHNMGEGISPDNQRFEEVAAQLRLDGVFVAHIKGQWVYRAADVPYYIDGGAGGEVYVGSGEEVGVDFGYWHGFRVIRVAPNGRIVTDAVPVFVPDGITVRGPETVALQEAAQFRATGRQPTEEGPAVEALALQDPNPTRPNARNLPSPARIWTSGDGNILTPEPEAPDDPRRDPDTQTAHGRFRAVCPGTTSVTITSGVQSKTVGVRVPNVDDGPLASSFRREVRWIRRRVPKRVASLRVEQPVRVRAVVLRGRRVIRTLLHTCVRRGEGVVRIRWDGRDARRRRLRRGNYTLRVSVLSDRRPLVRRWRIELR